MNKKKAALLLILDGWGHREETDSNAIAAAHTPNWDTLWQTRPHTLIDTSGMSVGLPAGQMGNSEVGHMNLGAGRVVYQNLTRIDKDIADKTFFTNKALVDGINLTVNSETALHIFGLLSPGGIHSHEDQINAMVQLAISGGAPKIYLHAFLDGRDTPPQSALPSLLATDKLLRDSGKGRIASICGRFYAMDRDNRWERVEPAYNLLVAGDSEFRYSSAADALNAAYGREETDEFVAPSVITDEDGEAAIVNDGDVIVFMNFRSDRARELTRAFVDDNFDGFSRTNRPMLGDFITLTEYAADIDATVAYPPATLNNVLGETLAAQNKTQLRIAETEKYAHVTFFFNGGREEPFPGEDRILIPSPQVKTYDLKPEMSAFEVTEQLCQAIRSGKYDAIICNYANGDMVGHTGDFAASVKAVEAVDSCLKLIVEAILETDGQLLITADHGNVEQMLDPQTNQPLTSHTSGPVPLVYVGNKGFRFVSEGSLSDIAPTLLTLMESPIPAEMTGKVLVETR